MNTRNGTTDRHVRAEYIREASVIANKIKPERAGQIITVSLREFLPTTVKTMGFRAVEWRDWKVRRLVWVVEKVL